MFCDVISVVAEFMVRVFHSRVLLGFTMFCDAISVVAEFMVSAFHSRVPLGFTMLLGLKPGRACDPTACLSGVLFLTNSTTNCVTTLKDTWKTVRSSEFL
jgi:hypothetical protein